MSGYFAEDYFDKDLLVALSNSLGHQEVDARGKKARSGSSTFA